MRICGCNIDPKDAKRLAYDLDAGGAVEAAAAIRWANGTDGDADILDPDVIAAIRRTFAIVEATGSLAYLRDALDGGCC